MSLCNKKSLLFIKNHKIKKIIIINKDKNKAILLIISEL